MCKDGERWSGPVQAVLFAGPAFTCCFRVPLCVPLRRDSFCRLLLVTGAPCVEMEAGSVSWRVPFRRTPRPVPGRSVGGAMVAARSGGVSLASSLLGALTLVTLPAPPAAPAAEGPAPLGSVRVHCLGSAGLL